MEERRTKKTNTLVIAIYSHIEAYPPSLNALYHLATIFDRIIILVPNNMESKWVYPPNVKLMFFGEYEDVALGKHKSLIKKVKSYFGFGLTLRKLIRQSQPSIVAAFDPASFALLELLSGGLLIKKRIPVWYHNHDVADEKELPRFSLIRLSRRLELKFFGRIKYFSIPNSIRLKYFPIDRLEHAPEIIPNYPSKFLFGKHYKENHDIETVRIIFQGQISQSTVPDIFVKILKSFSGDRRIELHLAGPATKNHLAHLKALAVSDGVGDQFHYHGLLPYAELPMLTATCNIGIAIYGDHNTMVRTMSTASNKIFEYASLGLPVIMNNRQDMISEFGYYKWIKFCGLDESSVLAAITDILANYSEFHTRARLDFEEKLNFEVAFVPFLKRIQRDMGQ